MKKILASVICVVVFTLTGWAQNTNDDLRAPAIGVSFFFNDYTTPQRIRAASLNNVLRNNQWADFKEMSPGIALTYFTGLHKYIDFAGTLGASFVRMPVKNQASMSDESLLLEADASFNFKMFPERYVFTPYLIAGVGASRYKSSYGGFLPLGGGFKINIFDEASLYIQTQYRIPLTNETNNYHFVTSLGISGVVGKKKVRS
jgi:hypothetical protein